MTEIFTFSRSLRNSGSGGRFELCKSQKSLHSSLGTENNLHISKVRACNDVIASSSVGNALPLPVVLRKHLSVRKVLMNETCSAPSYLHPGGEYTELDEALDSGHICVYITQTTYRIGRNFDVV